MLKEIIFLFQLPGSLDLQWGKLPTLELVGKSSKSLAFRADLGLDLGLDPGQRESTLVTDTGRAGAEFLFMCNITDSAKNTAGNQRE